MREQDIWGFLVASYFTFVALCIGTGRQISGLFICAIFDDVYVVVVTRGITHDGLAEKYGIGVGGWGVRVEQ